MLIGMRILSAKCQAYLESCCLSLFLVLAVACASHAQEIDAVVGCGGFIRWGSIHVKTKIDYQRLKVNLYLEETGVLKDVTEVLPNGAFSVPLYDQGPYRLKLSAPKGWHVVPADGYSVDLQSNPKACANDFNFEILGFTLTGQVVTYGLNTGPTGLLVRLATTHDVAPEVRTKTQADGHFILGPVIPGEYTLTVSEGEQVVSEHARAHTTVVVGSDSVVLSQPIMLMGHFVRGHIVDLTGKSLSNVPVYLLADTSSASIDCTRVSEDKSRSVQFPPDLTASYKVVCETITDAVGQFLFNRLPGGNYTLVPQYSLHLDDSGPPIAFAFDPPFVRVSVEHTDITLGSGTFRVSSFQLAPGRVLWPNGRPVSGAKIYLSDAAKPVLSDSQGFYQVGFIQQQSYTIRVESENAEFPEHTAHFSPDTKHLPQFQPSKLSVCGRLESKEDLLTVANKLDASVEVIDSKSGSLVRVPAIFRDDALQFCILLAPGRYELSPDVRLGDATTPKMYFAPASQTVELYAGPVLDVLFSQFTAKITGRITCLVSCSTDSGQLLVHLSPVSNNNNSVAPGVLHSPLTFHKGVPSVGYFEFENIFPGDYSISVVHQTKDHVFPVDGWCWTEAPKTVSDSSAMSSSRVIQVRHKNLDWNTDPVLDFVQSGFAVRVQFVQSALIRSLPPDIFLQATGRTQPMENSTKALVLHWTLDKLTTKICLPSDKFIYELSVSSSCVKLNPPSLSLIHPAKDCAPVLANGPLVRLTVSQLPLLVQLQYEQAFESSDRMVLTKAPIRVDVTQPADGTSQGTATVTKLLARWSTPDTAQSPPVAQVLLWIDGNQSVLVKPKVASVHPDRWFFTHMFTTESLILNVQQSEESQADADTSEFIFIPSTTGPSESANRNPPTNAKEFAQCAHLYTNQTAQFGVRLAVALRGETQPAVKKAEVRLMLKPPKRTEDPELTADEPLLPLHLTDPSQTTADTNSTAKTDETASSPLEVTITDVDGTFLFGPVPIEPQPVPGSTLYRLPNPTDVLTVTIQKPGYDFVLQPPHSTSYQTAPSNWVFKATKLSLVEVLVHRDETEVDGNTRKPLQGVLVSIIGEGHRGNQFTDKNGLVHFVGLAPGQYYLRPMMKEYLFTVVKPKAEQSGQASPVTVSEGVSVQVEVVAKRIAFSLSGTVTSLAKLPEPNVLVEAEWISSLAPDQHVMRFPSTLNATCQLKVGDASAVLKEQAWTDSSGRFQIRGLLPGCLYAVSVHTSNITYVGQGTHRSSPSDMDAASKTVVERAIPAVVHVLMAPYDASGLSFFAIRPLFMSTLTVSVDTADEFLPSLRLSLFPLDRPDLVTVTHDFSTDSLLFHLTGPKLAAIVGQDHVLRLESTLDPTFYTNIASQDMVIRPKPDRSEHLQFSFRPKLRSNYPESTSRNEL